MTCVSSLVVAAVFAVLYVVYRRKDRRLLRNGVFLVIAAFYAVVGVVNLLLAAVPGFDLVVVLLLVLAPLAVVVLAGFAIANGVTVIRREGLSAGTSLSLLAGVALLVLPAVGLFLIRSEQPNAVRAALLLFVACAYLGVAFVAFLLYSVVYGRMQHRVQPAALVILGSRVIDGRVPPLLASRLDRALQLYRKQAATGSAPLLIPTGGKGDDETRSEGSAMAE